MAATHRAEVEAILAGARAERAAMLAGVSPAMRASLPVDGTGIAQAIERLGEAAGLSEALRRQQASGHRANPAVLHGRVFGRAPLSADTVLAAFVEGARVRADALLRLAGAIGGDDLEQKVRTLLGEHPPDAAVRGRDASAALRAAYAAQEEAAIRIAAHLDGEGG